MTGELVRILGGVNRDSGRSSAGPLIEQAKCGRVNECWVVIRVVYECWREEVHGGCSAGQARHCLEKPMKRLRLPFGWSVEGSIQRRDALSPPLATHGIRHREHAIPVSQTTVILSSLACRAQQNLHHTLCSYRRYNWRKGETYLWSSLLW